MLRIATCGRNGATERAMRAQMLAALEELCRDMTLHDVREWYADSMTELPVAEPFGASAPAAGPA